MKRSSLRSAVAFATILLVVSCKKNKDNATPPAADVAPINTAFFLNTPVNISTTGSGNYEYGFKFGVTRNGKITKLGCRMPEAGTYRVTLWKAGTPATQIGQASVTAAAGTATYVALGSAVTVNTSDTYYVTLFSTGKWYEIRPAAAASFSYPITVGNISIKGYQWIGTAVTPITFPTNTETSYVAGVADFEFQAD